MRNLSKGEVTILLNNLVILIDTREKEFKHITKYFDNKNIRYESRKLDFGDYSCYIPKVQGITQENIFLNDLITIERKADLNELCNNCLKGRERFVKEFKRKKGKMILLIEENSYKDLIQGNYISQFHPKSFNASLMSFRAKYDIELFFLNNKKYSGVYIYTLLYYVAKVYLENLEIPT